MSDGSTTLPPIDAGQIRFVHHALPPLPAGEFLIEVDQEVEREGVGATGTEVFSAAQHIHVDGPRFGIAPADVHAAYPPPNSAGDYNDTLPHVVLRRRTLPWEIDLFGDNATRRRPVPWVALLLFHPGEAPSVSTGPRSELLAADASGVRVPTLAEFATDGDPLVTVADVDATTFRAVIPLQRELPWTAHVREVRTDGKELLGLADDGWFSVVLSNRLPAAGENIVHLVSLEGWDQQIRSANQRRGPTPFRLVSLASWTFTSSDRGSFETKIAAVSNGLLIADRPPRRKDGGDESVAATIVSNALEDGFVPLRFDMRQGEQSVAWYRGPLTPVSVPRTRDRAPLPRAEAGLVYHPNLAMFDVSHAVAWQIGRLLGLSDPTFAAELMRWRQRGQAQVDHLLARDEAFERHARLAAFERIDQLVERVAGWRRDADRGVAWSDDDRAELEADLRKLVLELWDPNSIATTIAGFAESDILTRLVLDGVLPTQPDAKRYLGATDDG